MKPLSASVLKFILSTCLLYAGKLFCKQVKLAKLSNKVEHLFSRIYIVVYFSEFTGKSNVCDSLDVISSV